MGALPLVENMRIRCKDGTLVRLRVFTDTDNLAAGGDGYAGVHGEAGSGQAFAFHLSLSKFGDVWLNRFCDALAASAGFRDSLAAVEDGDGLVVPAAPARDEGRLAALVRKGKEARFKDYVGLRSGRDRFSAMRLPELEAQAGESACAEMDVRMANVPETDRLAERAKALRWFLRGMPVAMAVRKAEVDREVAANAAGRGPAR